MVLFRPAAALLDRFRFPIKFAIIFALILIPLVVLTAILFKDLAAQKSFLRDERMGLTYMQAIRQPLQNIQRHRGLMVQYLSGQTGFRQQLRDNRKMVDADLAALQQVDKRLGTALHTDGKLKAILDAWNAIKDTAEQVKPAESLKAHNELVALLMNLISQVSDASQITLDPKLDSYYLGDALVNRLPSLSDAMGLARATGSKVAAAGKFTQEQLVELSVLESNIATFSDNLDNGLAAAFKDNPALQVRLGPAAKQSNDAVKAIKQLLSDKLLSAEKIEVSPELIFNNATDAITKTYALYDKIVPALDTLFQNRISAIEHKITVSSLVSGIVLVLIAYLFTGLYFSIRSSMQKIGDATQHLADGNLTARVDINTGDEMAMIAKQFNAMTANFEGMVKQIINVAAQLASAAEEVAAVSRDSATNVDRQRLETDQVATAMTEMSATVQEVAHSAAAAASAAASADNEAKGGGHIVSQATDAISKLANEINNTTEVISAVERDSDNIGSVLDVIKSVAEQTNLLALNAAIEAARAGEQGRGFAVVADEVRTLASRTQESTQEIEQMIARLQHGAQQAVEVMQQSRDQTTTVVSLAQEASAALQAITRSVATINEMNTQIASAAEEQASTTEDMNRNISSIQEVADQTASGANQTTATSEELARLATQLQTLVNQFNIHSGAAS